MFNEKSTVFLGIISMLFVLVFVSGCQKTEVQDLDLNDNKDVLEETFDVVAEEVVDEDKEGQVPIVLENKENVEEEFIIVFEDLSWRQYSNNLLDYSMDYPTIINVMGNDLDQHVEFTGPLSNNEWWPRISVSHYSSDFYRPSEDINVAEWVKPFPGYKLGEKVSIAGLEVVHYVQEKTPQAWAADYFYFIKDNQLYNITIIHSNDKQDWQLYNKILDSFIFDDVIEIE